MAGTDIDREERRGWGGRGLGRSHVSFFLPANNFFTILIEGGKIYCLINRSLRYEYFQKKKNEKCARNMLLFIRQRNSLALLERLRLGP